MTKLEKALYAKWISRFGRAKVRELSDGLEAGKSIGERSEAVLKSISAEELSGLLLEGFQGFFHQTVYLRKMNKPRASTQALKDIPEGGEDSVTMETVNESPGGEVRCLLMVERTMEFLPQEAGPVVSEEIPFPVAVSVSKEILAVQVLTMQSTVETWGEILGKDLRRILTFVHADALNDQVLDFLRQSNVDVGDYVNYSSAAIKLLKRGDISTYSGTMEVGTAGSTKHDTVRGRGKKSLRDSMNEEFQKLVSAKRMVNAEVELRGDHLGLKAGSKLALYPTVGKMAFRSNLGGSDPDEFIQAMAKS